MAKTTQALKSTLVILLPLAGACSAVLDRSIEQCSTDGDCAKFQTGNIAHAVCRDGVCADSGLGPRGCFADSPRTNLDFLNACVGQDVKYMSFDNCGRLGICAPGAALPEPTTPSTGKAKTSVTPVPPPTVRCADAGPNVIYMAGAADFGPLLQQVTPLLAANTPPYRGVFVNGSSCTGVSSVFDSAASIIKDTPGTATTAANYAFYFDDSGKQVSCTLDPEGKTVDIGVSDLFASECNPNYVVGGSIAEYLGPVVSFGLIVPAASQQFSISVEAAHMIFGLGGMNPITGAGVTPWTDYNFYSIRNGGAAATALTAALIHVPRTAFWGMDRLSPDNTRDALKTTANPEQSIGIVSMDYADKNRGNLRTLYVQGEGQVSGFLADSTSTSTNKSNVRDGHYQLWGYVHFFTASVGGNPSPAAGAFVTRFSLEKLDQALVSAMIDASLVPRCAMKVARETEMGPFVPNPLKFRCGCFFDYRTTNHASCPPCASDNDCAAGSSCNYGFCEKISY